MVWILPIACERLAKYRIQGFLHSSIDILAPNFLFQRNEGYVRRLDVPSTQVKFNHGYKALDRVLNFWHWKESFRVGHEAAAIMVSSSLVEVVESSYFVILSNIDLGSRMKVGRTTLLRSAPGRNCEMMCERTGRRRIQYVFTQTQRRLLRTDHFLDLAPPLDWVRFSSSKLFGVVALTCLIFSAGSLRPRFLTRISYSKKRSELAQIPNRVSSWHWHKHEKMGVFKTYYSATCGGAHGRGSHGRGASLLEATMGMLRARRSVSLVLGKSKRIR